MKRLSFYLIGLIMAASLSGCLDGVDTGKTPEQVRAEAPGMSKEALEEIAKAYADKISSTTAEYRKAQDRIKAIPYQDLMGKKALAVKERAGKLSAKLSTLNLHYDTYLQHYLEKGGEYEKVRRRR